MGPPRVATAVGRLVGSFCPEDGLELLGDSQAKGEALLVHLDGHIDNAAELRRELGSGEELLAAGYRRWGFGLPGRLRGDFVLAIWDAERREGLLARDQLGIRPVFLAKAGRRMYFAGELRDLLDCLPTTPRPDFAGVVHWIALSTRPGPGTLYAGVEKLGPGELLRFDSAGMHRQRYWRPRFLEPLPLSGDEFASAVGETLVTAVERRLDPKRDTGVLLSGGLDSASVAAVAGDHLRACSGTFPEHPQADESGLIEELRHALGLGGLVAEARPGGLLASVVEHVATWRAPLIGWGDFWTLPLMREAAARGVGTMLDGDGGDEVFGPRLYVLADALRSGRPRRLLELARRLPGAGPHVGLRQEGAMIARLAVGGALPPPPAGRRPPLRGDPPSWLSRRTRRALWRSDDPDAWKRLDGPRWWANAAYGIAYGIEATGVFEHQRRRAVLAGLEARHPMLDLDLVELALRQAPEQTLDPRFSRPMLRAAMSGLLPDSVRLRPQKALFESLIVSALAGPDGAAARELLTDPHAEIAAYVEQGQMVDVLFGTEKLQKQEPFQWMWQVWRLLNAELWLRSLASPNGVLEPKTALSPPRVQVHAV